MFSSQYPNAFTEGKGTLRLVAWVFVAGVSFEATIIEADAATQKATVHKPGQHFTIIVDFRNIQNVALKYDDGTIEKNFGAPKVKRPESIAYIQYAETVQS